MNPISNRLSLTVQKNRHYFDTIIFRRGPEFIYRFNNKSLRGEIPVFTFHLPLPNWFEEQCRFLARNGYRTLTCDEMLFYLQSRQKPVKNSIMITFDDGLKHVWTVAYPILKKYNLNAVCFLVPGCISNEDLRIRPNLDDFWKKKISMNEIMKLEQHNSNLATWSEIKLMHESGVFDFQSHTMYHSLVFTSPKIIDFIHPAYDTHFYGNVHVPLYQVDGRDNTSRDPMLGMPIYESLPRLSAQRRFFDNEQLRKHCIDTVKTAGSTNFFNQKNWRSKLHRKIKTFCKQNKVSGRYESPLERDLAVHKDLSDAKATIEAHLPGKKVRHLCFPWYDAAQFAVEAATETGYESCFFGLVNGRRTNKSGEDPLHITRLEDIYIERLPGHRRNSLPKLFLNACGRQIAGRKLMNGVTARSGV